MPAALLLDRVTRTYPGAARPAVDALSLEVRPGELLALVGASGSGKSTTLRAVAGYEYPDAGRVVLRAADGGERDITRLPPERRGFGMVFQHYALFPHLSVEDNVAFGLEARGVPKAERRARAREALAGVRLAGAGPRSVHALSGGEQQRVALARALVIEPSVLLLDEPLSNLDPTLRASTRAELRRLLTERRVTALLVTHDQEDAFAVADRVALLDGGRLLQVGAPEAVYDRPASRAVAAFVGAAALVPAALEPAAPDGDGGGAPQVAITVGGAAQRAHAALPPGADLAAARAWPGALAVLRPEQLVLAPPDADDAGGGWPGVVEARRFTGAGVALGVVLADGRRVEVATADRAARTGDRVRVRLAARTVAVVAADGAVGADASVPAAGRTA
jgi:ABC-type Fe3+/spermidine/putrescine transport system ATPase subunit